MGTFASEERAAKALGIALPTFRSLLERRRLPGPQSDIGLFGSRALELACDRLFIAHVVMPDGRTVYENFTPKIEIAYRDRAGVPFLPRFKS